MADAINLKSRIPQFIAVVLLLSMTALAGWRMWTLPLWGWWPMMLLLSFWMAVVIFFLPTDPTEKKWLGAATLSGVLMGIGFPPYPIAFVMMVAWIPLLAVENGIYQSRDRTRPGKMFRYSYHAFVIFNIISTFWVTNTAFIAGVMANFVNAAFMATAMMLIHILMRRLPSKFAFLVLVCGWISFEYLHFNWDLSWPWLALGHALAQYPWAIQWFDTTGLFGGTLWVLALNWLGYSIVTRWLRAKPLRLWQYITLLLVPLCISLLIWFTIRESDAAGVKVTIVQPNFEPHYEKFDIPAEQQARRFYELSLAHVDSTTEYLVFPETSFEGVRLNTFRDNQEVRFFQEMLDSFPHLRLVAGISSYRILQPDELKDAQFRTHISPEKDTTFWDIQNSAVQLTSNQENFQVYFKSKLVPGPEILPFRKVLFFLKPIVEKLEGSYEGHTTQKERSVFTGGPLTVAPIICYESIYGDYVGDYVKKGANCLFIVTNDGWWDLTPGHMQHLRFGALRAIEHRRPIARSANTGTSCFIDIRGQIHDATKYGEAIAIEGKIKPETRITLYTRLGDVIAYLALAGLGLIVIAYVAIRFKAVPKPVT